MKDSTNAVCNLKTPYICTNKSHLFMSTIRLERKKLLDEIKKLPDGLLDEIYNYLQYVKFKTLHKKQTEIIETAFASQDILSKDWLKPEEDKAWENL
jgi:hypothetical protein